jgi:hypothetical protein
MRMDQRDTASRLSAAKNKATLTREEMESLPDFVTAKAKVEEQLSKVPPGPHKGNISEQLFWEEAVRLGQQAAEAEGTVNRMDTHGGLHFLNKLGILDLKSGASSEEVRERLLAFSEQKQRAATALMAYGKSGFPTTPTSPKTAEDKANMASNLLLNFQSFRAQPRYSSVEEAYKNVQIEAIGKSPLEQALDRQLGQRLDQLLKEAQKANLLTEQQAQETRQMMGRN